MKATETRTSAAQAAKKTSPFFGKGAGQGFFKPAVQTKLTVGEPGDHYEKEADAMADQVMRKKEANGVSGETGIAKSIRRKPIFESENDPVSVVQRKCAACEQEETVQRKASTDGSATASPAVESGIAGSKGSGSALPAATQQRMESSFGADFSGVRVHDNSSAQQMNKDLNAQAFTHGKDIYFGAGKYKPQHSEGQHLLAHELTHVVQQTGKGNKKIQRAAKAKKEKKKKPDDKCDELNVGRASIADVTQKCPHEDGSILPGSRKTMVIQNLPVKSNADEDFLKLLGEDLPITLPKPATRKENPTRQKTKWNGLARDGVEGMLDKYLSKTDKGHTLDEKKDKKNLYTLQLKHGSRDTKLIGTYRNLVDDCLVPKWTIKGKPQAFQIEHIVDYQIAGAKADNDNNLILLSARINGELGNFMAGKILAKIQNILDHYRKYVPAKVLPEKAAEARKSMDIQAASLGKVENTLNRNDIIYPGDMHSESKDNPLRPTNVEITPFNKPVPKNHFLLQSREGGEMLLLPFTEEHLDVGSYQLMLHGNDETGLQGITAFLIIDGSAPGDKPKRKDYKAEKVPGITKAYRVSKFGYDMSMLKINYLSMVKFGTPVHDENLNITVSGTINEPTARFLGGTPIEVELNGRDLSFQKTFSAENLGKVGPITVDSADLQLSYSTQQGFAVGGGADFSIAKVGKGHIDAKKGDMGFDLNGQFDFDSKTFDEATITVRYSSGKDGPNGQPWAIWGHLSISEKKVKGIQSANITVGYQKGMLTFSGDATLTVPGLKGASIEGSYDGKTFRLALNGTFEFDSKYIQKGAKLGLTLATGGDDEGMKLAISGKLVLTVSEKVGPVEVDVNYDQGDFSAEVRGHDIKIHDRVRAAVTLGITNRQVDADGNATKGTGQGKKLRIYGSGAITVKLTDHLRPTAGVKLTPEGKLLLSGQIAVVNLPLMETEDGKGMFHGDYQIFSLNTGDIVLFSVGVADLYVNIGGHANAYYDIGVPILNGKLGTENVDIFDKNSFNLYGELATTFKGEAGVDMNAHIEIGGSLAHILKGYGQIDGDLILRGTTDFTPSFKVSYTPDTGFHIDHIDLDINADILARGTLSGTIGVKLDLFVKTIKLWSHKWDLGSVDLGELGKVQLHFPIYSGSNGEVVKPSEQSLRPDSPFSKDSAGKQFMKGKVAGGDDDPNISRDVVMEKAKKEFEALPAMGPANPQYQQVMNRARFVDEAFTRDGPIPWAWIVPFWTAMEYEEFTVLTTRLRTPESSEDKLAVLHEFAMNHTRVSPEYIALLENEIRIAETPKKI